MGIFDQILNWTHKNNIQTLDLKKAFASNRVGARSQTVSYDYSVEKLLNRHAAHSLVFACVQKKCEAALDPEAFIEKFNGKEWEKVENHPLPSLLEKPNSLDTWDSFISFWIASEDIAGNFYAEIVRSAAGVPVELYPLNPARIQVFHNGYEITNYKFTNTDGRQIDLPAKDVLHSKNFNLQNRFLGMSRLQAALGEVEADRNQTIFTDAFFAGDGVPSGVLKAVNRTLTEPQAADMRARWMQRTSRKEVQVLDQNAEYQKIGSNLSEIENDSIRSYNQASICSVFGVPARLVGAYVGLLHGTNNATVKTDLVDLWINTMSPMFKSMRIFLTWNLLTQYDEAAVKQRTLRVNWDMSQVMALQEDESERHARARENFRAGGWTLNEFREATGKEPLEGDGDYFLQPRSIQPITPELQAQQAQEIVEKVPVKQITDGDTIEGEIIEDKKSIKIQKKTFDYEGLTLGREPTDLERSLDLKSMVSSFESNREALTAILTNLKDDLITQASETVNNLDEKNIYSLTLTPNPKSYKQVGKLLRKSFEDGRAQVIEDLNRQRNKKNLGLLETKDLDIDEEEITRLTDVTVSRIVNEVQKSAISAVASFIVLGEKISDIAGKVKDALLEQKMNFLGLFAGSAVNSAANKGRKAQFEESIDEIEYFEYSALLDKSVCVNCENFDGLTSQKIENLPDTPNPECLGKDLCRCFIIAVSV